MVKNLLRLDKKGVSLMIGYVLLIVIVISLSIAVFAYLKLYLPKDQPKCQDNVILSIDEVTCVVSETVPTQYEVSVTLTNRGLFNINGAFIRIGGVGRIVKISLNKADEYLISAPDFGDNIKSSWNIIPGKCCL